MDATRYNVVSGIRTIQKTGECLAWRTPPFSCEPCAKAFAQTNMGRAFLRLVDRGLFGLRQPLATSAPSAKNGAFAYVRGTADSGSADGVSGVCL